MLVPLSETRFSFLAEDYFETLVTTILSEETETFKEVTLLQRDFTWSIDTSSANLLVLSIDFFPIEL